MSQVAPILRPIDPLQKALVQLNSELPKAKRWKSAQLNHFGGLSIEFFQRRDGLCALYLPDRDSSLVRIQRWQPGGFLDQDYRMQVPTSSVVYTGTSAFSIQTLWRANYHGSSVSTLSPASASQLIEYTQASTSPSQSGTASSQFVTWYKKLSARSSEPLSQKECWVASGNISREAFLSPLAAVERSVRKAELGRTDSSTVGYGLNRRLLYLRWKYQGEPAPGMVAGLSRLLAQSAYLRSQKTVLGTTDRDGLELLMELEPTQTATEAQGLVQNHLDSIASGESTGRDVQRALQSLKEQVFTSLLDPQLQGGFLANYVLQQGDFSDAEKLFRSLPELDEPALREVAQSLVLETITVIESEQKDVDEP